MPLPMMMPVMVSVVQVRGCRRRSGSRKRRRAQRKRERQSSEHRCSLLHDRDLLFLTFARYARRRPDSGVSRTTLRFPAYLLCGAADLALAGAALRAAVVLFWLVVLRLAGDFAVVVFVVVCGRGAVAAKTGAPSESTKASVSRVLTILFMTVTSNGLTATQHGARLWPKVKNHGNPRAVLGLASSSDGTGRDKSPSLAHLLGCHNTNS
jgi:hypothetical protein